MRRIWQGVVLALVLTQTASAWAFCGFYVAGGDAKLFNDATQVALMRFETTTILSMQNNYEGPPENFAMVVPVPQVLQEENVRTLSSALFQKLDTLTAPRLVEYWEQDPCQPQYEFEDERSMVSVDSDDGADYSEAEEYEEPKVVVEAEFSVGEYDIVILSAKESTALERWLKAENYKIPDGAAPYLEPYVQSGMFFFVAKVDLKKVQYADGRAVLSPLRFHFEDEDFRLPVRLGMINSKGEQDLIVYTLGWGVRYDVANYDNVFIPTNIEVTDEVKSRFGDFYRALFKHAVSKAGGGYGVVTEYSWDAGSCDPCPGPTLDLNDYATLGADLFGLENSQWVVTRLHARYGANQVGEDLVFSVAPPVSGGNEWPRDDNGKLATGPIENSRNGFQGRYIIRHEWSGPIECENPRRGIWGAPTTDTAKSPNSGGAPPSAAPAEIELGAVIKDSLPEVSVVASPGVRRGIGPKFPKIEKGACRGCTSSDAGAGGLLTALLLFGLVRRRGRG